MIAGFFIGLALWSAIYSYLHFSSKWYESVDYGAVFASLVVIAGNGAGIGYWWCA